MRKQSLGMVKDGLLVVRLLQFVTSSWSILVKHYNSCIQRILIHNILKRATPKPKLIQQKARNIAEKKCTSNINSNSSGNHNYDS